MALFEVIEEEGVRFVRCSLAAETIRVEAGAMSHCRGEVAMRAAVPSIPTFVASALSEERAVRPTFTGSGEVVLEASVAGFHVFTIADEPWILTRGAYWASEAGVDVGVHRERVLNAFFAGDGFIDFCTRVTGRGQVVVNARGPAEEIALAADEVFAVEGVGVVIARTEGVRYRLRRPARSIIGSWISGERVLRVYTGPGRIVVARTPYWGAILLEKVSQAAGRGSAAAPGRPASDPAQTERA